jgi:hypothetical protein
MPLPDWCDGAIASGSSSPMTISCHRLVGKDAAVHRDRRTGEISSQVRRQESHDIGDVFWLADTKQGDRAEEGLPISVVGDEVLDKWCGDETGMNPIHADPRWG